jgi:hypothetical protein
MNGEKFELLQAIVAQYKRLGCTDSFETMDTLLSKAGFTLLYLADGTLHVAFIKGDTEKDAIEFVFRV